MRTIAVLNQKGGVGKTTTTVNTAAALATLGQRVVVIDLDPQAHLTIHLGIEPQEIRSGSYEVLTQSAGFEESLMMVRPNLWALAANINLVGAETELVNIVGREIILREAMAACAEKFDFCLIDCAPSLGLLSLNALAAAQEVLIPLQPHFLALQGFGKLLQTVDLVNKRINRDLKVTGVLLCMFDTRASLPNEVRADIERFLENARGSACAWADAQLVPTFIRRNIKLAEAPSYGRTIFEYDPACNGAEDYKRVGQFFLGIEPELPSEPDFSEQPAVETQHPVSAPADMVEPPQDTEAGHEAEPQPHPVEANSHPPSAAEPVSESETSEMPPEPEVASNENEAAERSEPQPADTEVTQPSTPRELEPEPVMQHEFADQSTSDDTCEGHGNDAPEDLRLPPVAAAESPEETEPGMSSPTPEPEPQRQHSEGEPPNESEPQSHEPDATGGPIEIREFRPSPPHRYTPPPLQRYPIDPPEAHDEQQQGS